MITRVNNVIWNTIKNVANTFYLFSPVLIYCGIIMFIFWICKIFSKETMAETQMYIAILEAEKLKRGQS